MCPGLYHYKGLRCLSFSPLRFRKADDEGGEELGEETDETTTAGGGRATGGDADIEARKKLHVSHALRKFLAEIGEIKEEDVGGDDNEQTVR